MKATIWISRENEKFWASLPNKSGFINELLDAYIKEIEKQNQFYEDINDGKYARDVDGNREV